MEKTSNSLKKILVVEDDNALFDAISMKLKGNNFQVLRSSNASDAFSILTENEDVEFIWLDHYLLGVENGFDFALRVKADDSKFRNIPVFVVSNTASEDKVKSYIALGVDRYYIKAEHSLEGLIEKMKDHIQ